MAAPVDHRQPFVQRLTVWVRAVALVSACALIPSHAPTRAAAAQLRFHHFHFRVGEPAAALSFGVQALAATRVMQRGLGPGVRLGGGYAFFDRLDASQAGDRSGGSAERAYGQAREWLQSHGIDVDDASSAVRTRLASAFASELLDHVGFTAPDTRAIVDRLQSRGVNPIRQTADSTFLLIRETRERFGPSMIEIVRDLDRPETFWCPMHPDVRSADEEKCPICGMALVAIPPPRLGEYRMDVAMTPARNGRGLAKLRLTLRDPVTERPVPSFVRIHERLLHLFIIGRDLEYFQHVHPEPVADGMFALRQDVPPGEYVIIADFLPSGGRAQMVQRAIVTPGFRGKVLTNPPMLTADASTVKTIDGVRVQLAASQLRAGKEALLRFSLSDVATGKELADLQPFLGAPGHLLMVNADLTDSNHVHPEEADTRGPALTFQPLMPAAGFYKVWVQFQRGGVVSTVPFVVAVEGP
jgi:hypothetical protein